MSESMAVCGSDGLRLDPLVLPFPDLQVIPSITNTFGIPLMLLPLFFVVCVDAIFMVRIEATLAGHCVSPLLIFGDYFRLRTGSR